jgi:Excalibur calcium-binding domain
MKALPDGWRDRPSRGPSIESGGRMKHRFWPLWRAHSRGTRHRRLFRKAKSWVLAAAAAGLLGLSLSQSPWPVRVTLKHLAAAPNCAAARAVGLAPASRGQPGYWASHDRDGDGWACEPWPRRGQGSSPAIRLVPRDHQ